MKTMTIDTMIEATPDTVWAFVGDPASWPETMSAITRVEVLTDGEVGVGTRFAETRVMFGREATEEMTIAAYEPPHRMLFQAESGGTKYESVMRLEPAEGGRTRAVFEFTASPQALSARVLGAVFAPLMKGSLCKAIEGDLADIKAACEGEGVAHDAESADDELQ